MKSILNICIMALCVLFFSCQSDEETLNDVGYLSLNVTRDISTETKAVPEDYNAKQIAVQILNSKNEIVEETDNWTNWKDKTVELKVGTYTIKASSNGFDGKEAAFDAPYYAASKQIAIKNNTTLNESLTCTLANVKVTVKYDADLVAAFKTIAATVSDATETQSLSFAITETRSAYFPVADLTANITLVNHQNGKHSLKKEFTDVKARDHYILNYRLAPTGQSNITVTVDATTNTYTYTFTVGNQTQSATLSANAWSRFAYLEATDVSGVTADMELKFQYRVKDSDDWTDCVATEKEGNYVTDKISGLTAGVAYEYQLVGNDEPIGDVAEFTTERTIELVNGKFDDWYQDGKTVYAVSEADFKAGNTFWDSSNPGTTQGAGAFVNINPTTGVASPVHTPSGKAAELKSAYAIIKFAAASLYTGSFGGLVGTKGAKINFGQPFTSRPTALHGYFQYAPAAIGYVGSSQPANTVKKGDMDICSIYIALAKKQYQVDNTDVSTFIDFENDDNIIAYGELPASECVSTEGAWKEFTANLKYKNLTDKPTHLIIVSSSSKYGDYFTGGEGSRLYLDDFELLYGDTPTMWE